MNLRSLFEKTNNVQEFQAGSTIFAEGTSGDVMYVILDGEVEVRVRSELVEVAGPGGYRGGDGADRCESAQRHDRGQIGLSLSTGR